LFIRKIDDINTSFYTMEVRGTEIIQVRGKNNCSTTPEVQAFVEKFKTKKLESLLERMAG
jgi:chromosome segregation and condensation protein ScpB